VLEKPTRFYLVPKGPEFNTPPARLPFWVPVVHNKRCLVFTDFDEADACLAAIARSKGRREVEVAFAHRSFRCDKQRSTQYAWHSSSYRTDDRHVVPDVPEAGTIVVAVAWVREDVPLPNGGVGYRRSTPLTIPLVRMFRYDPIPTKGHLLRWGQLPALDTAVVAGGSVLGLFALSPLVNELGRLGGTLGGGRVWLVVLAEKV